MDRDILATDGDTACCTPSTSSVSHPFILPTFRRLVSCVCPASPCPAPSSPLPVSPPPLSRCILQRLVPPPLRLHPHRLEGLALHRHHVLTLLSMRLSQLRGEQNLWQAKNSVLLVAHLLANDLPSSQQFEPHATLTTSVKASSQVVWGILLSARLCAGKSG